MMWKRMGSWLLLVLWSVFVNACNVWFIGPLVEDLAVYGVVVAVMGVIAWLTSIPPAWRRRWIVFTMFSLLLGDGLSKLLLSTAPARWWYVLAMTVGLVVTGWLVSRWQLRYFVGSAIVLVLCNMWLPMEEWVWLPHFEVAYRTSVPTHATELPALPLQVIPTADGHAVVTLRSISDRRYEFVQVTEHGGSYHLSELPVGRLALLNPFEMSSANFPLVHAAWARVNGKAVQSISSGQSPQQVVETLSHAADLPAQWTAQAATVAEQERASWQDLLESFGQTESPSTLRVVDGKLIGQYHGRPLSIPVQAYAVVGVGSFTKATTHEVLLQGANRLQVVSLDEHRVVADYRGNPDHPVPNDLIVGEVAGNGRDAVLVNSSPAMILQPDAAGAWQKLYEAPNAALRFLAVLPPVNQQAPQIIANDRSYVRDSNTNYVTSYRYRDGQLLRNWRIYETDVANAQAVQFAAGQTPALVVDMNRSGHLFVLVPHRIPAVPLTAGGFAATLVVGWWLRLRGRRRERHA